LISLVPSPYHVPTIGNLADARLAALSEPERVKEGTMKILLVTGPASEAQGWGDAQTTEFIRATLEASGRDIEVLHVQDLDGLLRGLDKIRFDLAWSSIYQISNNTEFIGLKFSDPWVADVLEERGVPYVGSSAPVLKTMLDKSITRNLLAANGVSVPHQLIVELGEEVPVVDFPVFVKPRYESQSAGISEKSIAESHEALVERIRHVHEEYEQCALIEEFLPGTELTVSMLGECQSRGTQYHAVVNILKPSAYKKYPVIMTDIKDVLDLELANGWAKSAESLAAAAVTALGCRDHVRVDMREDRVGNLKIIEVNGIPGLTPGISRSCVIHRLCNPSLGETESFSSLVCSIVDSALYRATHRPPIADRSTTCPR